MKLLLKRTKPGELPYVELYHGTNRYNFLIDTGSTSNWIDPDCIPMFEKEGETSRHERTVNGSTVKTITTTLRVERRSYTDKDDLAFKFRVSFLGTKIPNFNELNSRTTRTIHGILGMEFLEENAASVDFETNQLSV